MSCKSATFGGGGWLLPWQCRYTPPPSVTPRSFLCSSYLVTNLMGADLNNIVKFQKLSDEHVQFLIYQLLRGLKVALCSCG